MHVCPAHMIGYTSSTAFIQPIVSNASKCGPGVALELQYICHRKSKLALYNLLLRL